MRVMMLGSITRLGQEFIKQSKLANTKFTIETYEDYTDRNTDEVRKLILNTDIILSFRGSSMLSLAHNIQVMSLADSYKKKFLLITSFGCGDSWDKLSDRAKNIFGDKVKYKTLSEVWLQLSALCWKIVRPVGLSDLPSGGKTMVTDNKELPHGYITRECLAKALIDIINNENWNDRKVLYVYNN